ncbi:mannitol dehydrogenase family protein [Nocardioides acrostichi]|uniref:Mannitol-1-phosphate 5-dehydrogenase n=1 Tax=Nocardioides acrostichi TaxID=2784339 RepID=A0A930V472_9ACTN|nr:mannitol dehydrogenase family protein [Nocardioides acrostichi]MBF4163517.1 mannitol dehydrogenase family protein [Nocardioides acrostichi]
MSQQTLQRLAPETLEDIGDRVPVPAYDRSRVRTGIVHLGVGGFHRAHQAMYVDALMNASPGDDEVLGWGITGVGVLPGDARMAEVMRAQGGLYTLVVKHPDGHLEPRVIGSIVDYLHAPAQGEEVLDLMAAPATRIVSLTVTEGGYHVNQVTGDFDPDDAGIQHDLGLGAGELPTTAFGFVVEALARRREAGVPAFTVMSCDNIQGNGHVAHQMIGAFARLRDERQGTDLADWIEREVVFANSMVDRITPVTTDDDRAALADRFGVEDAWPVVCEPFTQWALEDAFPTGRPAFEEVGVQVVPDVVPYELMKLRLLNASHQALCYPGYLAGHRYAHEVCHDPLFVDFLLGYMEHEGTPTLSEVPGVDLAQYRRQLIERFANPEVRDTLARLCAESSDRIPKWLVPVITERLAAGGSVDRAALVVASWARYAEGIDEQGEEIDVVDRRRDVVMQRAAAQLGEGADELAFLRDPALFGDLVDTPAFTGPYLAALRSLHEVGARATLEAWAARG